MTLPGYNPEFAKQVNAKRALAEMRRKMREAEVRAQKLEAAARAAADAILEGALEEARLIMRRAYADAAKPKRPVIEIITAVARERGFAPQALRGRNVTALAARQARREAILRVAKERPDLNYSEIGRLFGLSDGRIVSDVLCKAARHG